MKKYEFSLLYGKTGSVEISVRAKRLDCAEKMLQPIIKGKVDRYVLNCITKDALYAKIDA